MARITTKRRLTWGAPRRGAKGTWNYPLRGMGQHAWDGRSGMGNRGYSAMEPRVQTPQVTPWGRRAVRPPFKTPSGRPLMGAPDPSQFRRGAVHGRGAVAIGGAIAAIVGHWCGGKWGSRAESPRDWAIAGAAFTTIVSALKNKRATGEFFPSEEVVRAHEAWSGQEAIG